MSDGPPAAGAVEGMATLGGLARRVAAVESGLDGVARKLDSLAEQSSGWIMARQDVDELKERLDRLTYSIMGGMGALIVALIASVIALLARLH